MTLKIFGTRPTDAIYLPDVPYSVRLNCKDGGIFIGGYEAQHRRSNPDQEIEISIIKVAKFFGSFGKYDPLLWIQLFFIPAPSVDSAILPPNTVCCTYIKKQSISHLFNKVQEVMSQTDPGEGIFILKFNRETSEKGNYYSVDFNWRSRKSKAENAQLEQIKIFINQFGTNLSDLEGTRSLTCVDGWSNEQLTPLISGKGSNNPQLLGD